MNSLNQQAYLADFAPKQSLDKYAKGADPRVINGIVALSEMQQQAAMRQQANLANGAAQGQMPTVRDKIMQMFQQANQPRQQPQQQPNPMQQGIMAQAHPQMQTAPMPQGEAPEEARMYHGGVAHLPVNDRMFGYANGGIIAFRTGERPEDKKDYDPETDKEAETAAREAERTKFRAGLEALYSGAGTQGVKEPVQIAGIPSSTVPKQDTAPSKTLPDGRPNPAYQEFLRKEGSRDRGDDPFAYNQEKFPMPAGGIASAKPTVYTGESIPDTAKVPPTTQGVKPPTVNTVPPQRAAAPSGNATVNPNAPAAGTGIDALLAQQANRLAAQRTPVGPQLPEPDMAANTLKLLEAQEKYVRGNPNSPAVDKLLEYYADMRKRAIADDNAEAAQRVADKEQNLWSFLSNIRGGTLASAAQRANADLSARQSEQKTAAAAYRKYSYERDLNLNKADAELRLAEEERKRNRFDKALVHEEAARSYRLEAKKAEDTAQHYRDTAANQLLGTMATRESAKEGHLTQLQVAQITSAATRAGHPDYVAEYNQRVKRDGKAAADTWLESVGKVLGVTKGYDAKEESLNVQRDKAVTTALKEVEPYTRALSKIASLESKARAGKLTPAQQAELDAARADAKRYYDKKYQEIHRTAPPDRSGDTGGGVKPFIVNTPAGPMAFDSQEKADAFRAKIGG